MHPEPAERPSAPRSTRSILAAIPGLLLVLAIASAAGGEGGDVPRMPDGRPDLSGTYDIATLTPLERPAEFGENLYLTPEQAREIVDEQRAYSAKRSQRSDPNRAAPEVGGAPPVGLDDSQRGISGAGEVGGYNDFWIDSGDSVVMVDGKFRTSILTDPANGRRPPMTPEARAQMGQLLRQFRGDEGTAFWVDWEGPGPYDGPESRPTSDRCLTSFASTVPALPSLYNNLKRIVQTEDEVLILNEMVHDVRTVRIGGEHAPPEMTFWLGDSIGRWEGDTLVVDTTNFRPNPGFFGTTATLHVVERFTRVDRDTLHYEFTVEDPARWTAPWTGDFTWPITDGKVFEYACHEGNYAMGNILRGARILEREALENGAGESQGDAEGDAE
ncbi:MAG: hypothetical protein DWQ36_17735 [Acidobacteria bacterium]|nr:MAG: hypothetical protein DWQ30_15815 [Acidobacteriota bacterium]REK04282.1 MAG: hypothetical protein DWQ36_17735 [Acidobacteriota bacterium]